MQGNQTIVTYYITKWGSYFRERCTLLEIPTSKNIHKPQIVTTQTITINKVCGPEIKKKNIKKLGIKVSYKNR